MLDREARRSLPSPSRGAAGDGTPDDARPSFLSTNDSSGLMALLRAAAHAPPRPPPRVVSEGTTWGDEGRYTIRARLGRGAMGTVYSAHDSVLGRLVALKVLDGVDAEGLPEHRARVLREARIAARVEHDRVGRVYDVGEHDGLPFVAMELVRGVTLRRWMADGSLRDARAVLRTATQIAEGLAVLHAAGVVHRDLKPENVMITADGGVKLLDFGLARPAFTDPASASDHAAPADAAEESVTALAGTPGYMAPEQCTEGRVDARADVFALGVVVYELVTGERPFRGDSVRAVLESTLRGVPPLKGDAWRRAPPKLRAITERMLATDAERRFADGAAAARALAGVRDSRWSVRAAMMGGIAVLVVSAAALGMSAAKRERPQTPPGMKCVDVGKIVVGSSVADAERECANIGPGCDRERAFREVPAAEVTIAPFFLDVHEVTNDEFVEVLNMLSGQLRVVDDEDHQFPRYVQYNQSFGHDGEILADLHPIASGIERTADGYGVKPGREHFPMVQVTWFGAAAYCAVRGKRLPTENEWEAAARGTEGRPTPWGDASVVCGGVIVPRDGLLQIDPGCPSEIAVAPVETAFQDITPEGVHDLGGNVAEWVAGVFVPGDRQAVIVAPGLGTPRIIRGGSFAESMQARGRMRARRPPNVAAQNVGFRCAADAPAGASPPQ